MFTKLQHSPNRFRPRRLISLFIILALLLAACGGDDEEKTTSYTVGILNPLDIFEPGVEGFKAGMANAGYVEDDNVTYIYAGPQMTPETRVEAAQALVDADVDLIFTIATPGAQAVQSVTTEIPIIFTLVTDPIGAGLVESWSAPGGNITGISDSNPDPRRLQLLVQVDPSIERIYVPHDPSIQAVQVVLASVIEAAEALDIEIVTEGLSTDEAILAAIDNMPDDIDAVFMLPDITMSAFSDEWGVAAVARQLPFSPGSGTNMENVLMTFGVEFFPAGKQAARLAFQVLNGSPVEALPVEVLDFSLTINLVTAEAIGLEIPDAIVNLADIIIRPDAE